MSSSSQNPPNDTPIAFDASTRRAVDADLDVPAPQQYPLKPPLHNSSSPRDHEPEDIQKVLKWQEERITRKLRGEYESAILHLSEVVNDNLKTPMNISSVRVEGTPTTRKSFLGFLINPHLFPPSSSAPETGNLESVLQTTRRISHTLQQTDLFQTIEAKLERAQHALADSNDVEVVFKTREKGRYYLNTSTELGNNEGTASATCRVRNVFGGAELFEATMSLGTKTRKSYRSSLTVPLSSDLKTFGELSAFGLERDNTSFASSFEGLRGVKAVIRNGTASSGTHEFAYEAVLRHIGGLTPKASLSIREAAGQTSKSSISHTWLRDTRNNRIASTSGYYAKVFQELAGLGGDASFYKAETEGQFGRALWDGSALSFGARAGFLHGISKPTLFSDRFQLGGPTSVRAFKANGMGPRDGDDSLGGDLYWSAGLSLVSNLPRRPEWPVKAHYWINAGGLDNLDKGTSLLENAKKLVSSPCVSAGFGLIYKFDPVRVEVNFGVPLAARRSDGVRRGVQVGIGLEFL